MARRRTGTRLIPSHFFQGLFNTQFHFRRIEVCSKDSVPAYGPPLPSPPTFDDMKLLRKFLLTKCWCSSFFQFFFFILDFLFFLFFFSQVINAENAAYTAPSFGQRMTRTLEGLLEHISNTFTEKNDSALVAKKSASKSQLNVLEGFGDYGKFTKEDIVRQREQVHSSVATREDSRPMVRLSLLAHPSPVFTPELVSAPRDGSQSSWFLTFPERSSVVMPGANI